MLEPRTMNYLEILERIRDDVRQNMEPKLKDSDEIEWDVHYETLLFYAMRGLKPVGVNRHFMMTVIHDRFSFYIRKELSSKLIWDHLESLYDMAALHECEIIPFPNEAVEFELPEDVDDMVKEKYGVVLPRPPKDESETPKSNSNNKAVKKLGASKLKQSTNSTASTKNTFQTPVSVKSSKIHLGSRSEPRPSSVETIVKGKQDSQFPARINKLNRASSPFTTKNVKSDTVSTSESSATPVSTSKKSKSENQNSLSAKKTPKSESASSSNSMKKSAKAESNSSSSKQTKSETPDNFNKKMKGEKEQSSKKGKVSLPAENSVSKKSSKSDVKKTESENNLKKYSDTPTGKPKMEKERGSSKSSKYDDTESPLPSGSRKSSAGKVDTTDKKKKRLRAEESAKKGASPAKRRRTLNS